MSIFKAYDLRGIYPDELNEETAYKIGRATVAFLKVKQIVVGRDVRISGPKLFGALAKGINDQGADVIDIGLCSSPMLYFAVNFLKAKGSVMVTASHNPKEYNGFKFTRENAIPISEDTGIKDIERLVNKNQFKDAQKKGKIIKKEVLSDYTKFVLKFAKNIKPLKVVIDTANGMGGLEVPKVFKKLP